MALFVSYILSACFCMISRHYQVYSSTTEYQRASLTILPTGNYNLPFMGHKIPYLSSLIVTCHQSSRLYGVLQILEGVSTQNSLPFWKPTKIVPLEIEHLPFLGPLWRKLALYST